MPVTLPVTTTTCRFGTALNGHPCCPRRTIVDSLQYACCSPCPSRCHAPSSWWQSVHPLTHLAGPSPVMFHCSCCRGSGTSDRTVQFALLLLTTIIHRCQAWEGFYRSLYLLKNFTVASNAPSLPALILGLLCMLAVSIRSKKSLGSRSEHVPNHHAQRSRGCSHPSMYARIPGQTCHHRGSRLRSSGIPAGTAGRSHSC